MKILKEQHIHRFDNARLVTVLKDKKTLFFLIWSPVKSQFCLKQVSCFLRIAPVHSVVAPLSIMLSDPSKGSEFVLSIDVLVQQGNVFQKQFNLKRFIDSFILLKGGSHKQKESPVHETVLPLLSFVAL